MATNLVKKLINEYHLDYGSIMHRLGCSYQSVRNWHLGKTNPSYPYRVKLGQMLIHEERLHRDKKIYLASKALSQEELEKNQ